jgi:NADH-quinone oxidoreductase subunit F
VETLANVLPILEMGGDAFAQIGVPGLTGTKLFCMSGHVARPGTYEVPGGATLRQLLELAGGLPNGRGLQAILMGGAAGSFVPLEHLDTPLINRDLARHGLSIGSGSVIVFDESVDMWEVTRLVAEFFAEESCGQCVPCRVGTKRQVEILHRFTLGHGKSGDTDLLQEIGGVMTDASICGLGQTAASAVLSALKLFPHPGETGNA